MSPQDRGSTSAHSSRIDAMSSLLREQEFPEYSWLAEGLLTVLREWDPAVPTQGKRSKEEVELRSLIQVALLGAVERADGGSDYAVYSLLKHLQRGGWPLNGLITHLRGRVDFLAALSARPRFAPLLAQACWLWKQGLIDPGRVRWADLRVLAGWTRREARQNADLRDPWRQDPYSPVFWIALAPEAAWRAFHEYVSMLEMSEQAELFRGYFLAGCMVPCIFCIDEHGINECGRRWREQELAMHGPLLEHLVQTSSAAEPFASSMRNTWMLVWHHLSRDGAEAEMPEIDRARRVAREELGRLRPLLRGAGSLAEIERARLFETLAHGSDLLFEYGALWDGFRALLLAFRDCSTPMVAADLRYWIDASRADQPPEPWRNIPLTIASSFHHFAAAAQEGDPDLAKFRTQFSRFCLDRLKPNPKTRLPYESNVHWRRGYVEAVRRLCVNPDGRGHRVLHRLATEDADPVLRALAERAYSILRKSPEIRRDLSPRRVVFQAFLELRRAHMIALGREVDWNAAKTSTSDLEARRTTEPEEEVNT
jgi:hypothetical protein